MRIDINAVKKLLIDSKVESEGLGKIINPIIEKYNLPKKEIIEVCQIGKFIYKVDSEIIITEKPNPPRPDFIIKNDSKYIGLEHTRIFTENALNYNRIISILEYSEEIYKSLHPNDKVHGIVSIVDDKLDYKQSQKKEIATEIAEYIYKVKNEIEAQKPSYISKVRTTIHSKISFSYKEKNWQAPYLNKERLEKEIRKKEAKIKIYKSAETELSEYWLVLLIGSLSSASYELDENENYKTESEFDRVYLMADFDSKIIRVK
jgi:hypothetical protein